MGNHYHFVLHTRRANLSRLMRHENGVYSQTNIRRHGKVGHLFQGRFKAILVDRDIDLLALCRYVELNPVRLGMVAAPGDWPWSNYRAHVADAPTPQWLDSAGLHGDLLGHEPRHGRPPTRRGAADRRRAAARYAALVAVAPDGALWDSALSQQICLGDAEFVERLQALAELPRVGAHETPKAQRSRPTTMQQWIEGCGSREETRRRAHIEGGLNMAALARELGLSVSRVSRLIARSEAIGKT